MTLMLAALRDACDRRTPSGLQTYGRAYPRQLARLRWPDSPAWKHRTHRRNSTNGAVGGTMPMKAATVLWRLHDKGLVIAPGLGDSAWMINAAGRAWLNEKGM